MSTFVPKDFVATPEEECVVPTCIVLINAYVSIRNVFQCGLPEWDDFWDNVELVEKTTKYLEKKKRERSAVSISHSVCRRNA